MQCGSLHILITDRLGDRGKRQLYSFGCRLYLIHSCPGLATHCIHYYFIFRLFTRLTKCCEMRGVINLGICNWNEKKSLPRKDLKTKQHPFGLFPVHVIMRGQQKWPIFRLQTENKWAHMCPIGLTLMKSQLGPSNFRITIRILILILKPDQPATAALKLPDTAPLLGFWIGRVLKGREGIESGARKAKKKGQEGELKTCQTLQSCILWIRQDVNSHLNSSAWNK